MRANDDIYNEKSLLDEEEVRSLYLHFPFCASRCLYCDFETDEYKSNDPLMQEYSFALSFLVRSLAVAGITGNVSTIYFGGGTPSFMGNRNLSSLVYLISTRINLTDDTEFTLELNPDSFDKQMFKDLWALGVNRYSVGVQSFDDGVLRFLGRRHDSKKASDVLELLATRNANRSVDLICGIPGQSERSFLSDLERCIELGIEHVSIYPLVVEEGTPLSLQVSKGEVEKPDEDLQASEMIAAQELLAHAGLQRYEVSNYARPGFESRHNISYWTGRQYIGVGTSAASLLSVRAFRKVADTGLLEHDLQCDDLSSDAFVRMTQDASAFTQASSKTFSVTCEVLSRRQAICEQVMLRMRLARGIPDLLLRDAEKSVPGLKNTFDDLLAKGLVSKGSANWYPTQRGWLCGNDIYGPIWENASVDS